MSAVLIRKFLLRTPRPAHVIAYTGEDKREFDVPDMPHWGELAESLDALSPSKLEMYGRDHKILRVVGQADFDEQEEDAARDARERQRLIVDGETERFELVAKLLAEAHKQSYVAFDKLVDLFKFSRSDNDALRQSNTMLQQQVLELQQQLVQMQGDIREAEQEAAAAAADGKGEGALGELAKAFMGGVHSGASGTDGKGEA